MRERERDDQRERAALSSAPDQQPRMCAICVCGGENFAG